MNSRLKSIGAASLVMAGVSLGPGSAIADVRVCTFPGSPSTALDQSVAREAFRTAGIAASFAKGGFDSSDDDGVSIHELDKALKRSCDVIAGFPQSTVANGSDSKLLFSRGYLRAGYVSVTKKDAAPPSTGADDVVAATYASPAQLIAVQQRDVTLDLENTAALTVDAVATGHARRAIVWYPAVVAYAIAHPQQQFDVSGTTSPYADWRLVFAFGTNSASMRQRIDAALGRMASDGRLASLTHKWTLPDSALAARTSSATFAFRDGPARTTVGWRQAALAATETSGGGFLKVDATVAAGPPSFDRAQVTHGKSLYSGSCAKCHGADLQGVNAPALRGPAFAPAANAHLTIGGVYSYMASNMPADRPGKMKPQDYADIMSFLLYSNGYQAGNAKLTADDARASATPLNAGASR
ncbi:c-type cytochrome [Paraburkholderia sp. GAS334]|uniref:c-type cytochrome n=1 Tax=Paraburkholderia sp. GAS334 TaxID=3035131 RepID=UPI003D1C3A38